MDFTKRLAITAALGTLALTGCSNVTGPDRPKLSVSLLMERAMSPAPVLRAVMGDQTVELRGDRPERGSVQLRGPRFGEVPSRVALLSAAGDTLGGVTFSHHFERDNNHWVSAIVGIRRPLGHCIGTLTVAPLRGASGDTLFVMYGRIPEGAIC